MSGNAHPSRRDIDPTPVVGVIGLISSLERRPPVVSIAEGDELLVLGDESATEGPDALTGSFWADQIHGHRGGTLPALDLAAVARLVELLGGLVPTGAVAGIHDVADGGLAGCLAELVAQTGVGLVAPGLQDHTNLFSEAAGRVVVATTDPGAVEAAARAAGVDVRRLGRAGGDRLVIGALVDLLVADVVATWRNALPALLG